MRTVTIYSDDNCVYCRLAKRLLAERGIAYRELNLAMDADGRRALSQRIGRLTFPQIVVDGEPIGGYQQLCRLVASGEVDAAASLEQAA
jgi:glutaredoxin 3